MKTDGTVTELIRLLTGEEIHVVKIHENINLNMLNRHIFLRGIESKTNWLYAESNIYLDNLAKDFTRDLLEKTIPIGTLWINYRMETFKKLIRQYEEISDCHKGMGFKSGTKLLSRIYQVYNQQKVIMEITEKFPIHRFNDIL